MNHSIGPRRGYATAAQTAGAEPATPTEHAIAGDEAAGHRIGG